MDNNRRKRGAAASTARRSLTSREIDRLTTEEVKQKVLELQSAIDYAQGHRSGSHKKGRFTMRQQELKPHEASNRPTLSIKVHHALYRNPMAESRHFGFETPFSESLDGELSCPSGVDPSAFYQDEVENHINKIRTEAVSNRNSAIHKKWNCECSNFSPAKMSTVKLTHDLFGQPPISLTQAIIYSKTEQKPPSPEELKNAFKYARTLFKVFQDFFDGDIDKAASKEVYDIVCSFIMIFIPAYYPGGAKGLRSNMAENPGKPLLNYVSPNVIAHLVTYITSNYSVWKQQLELLSQGLTRKEIAEKYTAKKKILVTMSEEDQRKYTLETPKFMNKGFRPVGSSAMTKEGKKKYKDTRDKVKGVFVSEVLSPLDLITCS